MKLKRAFAAYGVVAMSLFAWLATPVSPADAADAAPIVVVRCGQVITRSITVANDLVNCPRHGLVIGAANITVDLNGHTIDGNGKLFDPCPADEPCNAGIANSGLRNGLPINGNGFAGVTIMNGSVKEFAEGGVYITGTSNNAVRSLHTSSSEFESDGVHLRACTSCRVENSTASDFSVGIVVERSRDVVVTNNDADDNTFAGILVALSQNVIVENNRVSDTLDGDGIVVLAESARVTVRGNRVFRNLGGIGIIGSDRNVVADNSAYDNKFVGVYTVAGGAGNAILRNTITHNGDGSEGGIHLVAGEEPGTNGTVVADNWIVANDGDGILVDRGNWGTRLERNEADFNDDDGIDVDSKATTVTGNNASANGDLGIEAVAGVIDGGGNRASYNGNAKQCVNIACR